MKKISSRLTFFNKKGFPIFWFGFFGFITVKILRSNQYQADNGSLYMLSFIFLIGFFIYIFFLHNLIDEVYDDGDALVIKNKGVEERIPLVEISDIYYNRWTNPPRVVLTLKRTTKFGDKIVFLPGMMILAFMKNPQIEDLIARLKLSRRELL